MQGSKEHKRWWRREEGAKDLEVLEAMLCKLMPSSPALKHETMNEQWGGAGRGSELELCGCGC